MAPQTTQTNIHAAGGETALAAAQAYLSQELQNHLGQFLDGTEHTLVDQLFVLKDAGERIAAQNAVSWIARNKRPLQDAFYRRLIGDLAKPRIAALSDLADLSLMDDLELAVTTARARMVSQVTEHARGHVMELQGRLTGLARSGFKVNPRALGPGHLADTFQSVLQEHGVPPRAQAVLIAAFDGDSVKVLIDFYAALNRLLHSHGIKPVFDDAAPADASTVYEQSHLQPRRSLDEQLKPLARPKAPPPQPPLPAQLATFFAELLQDARIAPRVRAELQRVLQALNGVSPPAAGELGHPDHPLRQFVRQLTLLGMRDLKAPLQDFDIIHAMVSRIVAERGQELDSFHSGTEALYTLARREVRRQSGRDQPVSGSEEADPTESLEEEARRQVQLELREYSAGLTLAPLVQEFVLHLLGPWMMVRHLRYGDQSAPWAEARAFAALFFDALRPAANAGEQQRKAALRRQALAQARLRTQRGRVPPEDAAILMHWLEQHFADLDGQPLEPHAAAAQVNPTFLEYLPRPALI